MELNPADVTDLDLAFGGRVRDLMPSMSDLPKHIDHVWVEWQRDWFFSGLKKMPTPKDGIDLNKAMRHLAAIQKSFEPNHEHKEAAVAYLASLWFEKP